MPSSAIAAYRRATVQTSSQRDLIVQLYVGAEGFLAQARDAMVSKPMPGREIMRADAMCAMARDIFSALLGTLNMAAGGEIAIQLRALYAFLIVKICEASLRKSPALIDELVPIVRTLREGWEQVPDDLANVTAMPSCQHGHTFSLSS